MLAVETIAVHALLVGRYPIVAWILTLSSVFAIIWVVRDYTALGRGAVLLEQQMLRLRIGRRYNIPIPFRNVARVLMPTFRDLPTPGTNEGRDYLNLTQPSTPNVLILVEPPMRVRIAAGLHRTVARIALHLDDPGGFAAALQARVTETTRNTWSATS